MKTITALFCMILTINGFILELYGQMDVKGKGSTGATVTFVTKNNLNDTSMIIFDNGKIGIDSTNPVNQLEVKGVIGASGGIKFGDGTLLTSAWGTTYFHVYTVALSGGDFPSIGAALAACASPSASNTYLVRVMPGTYNENVVCKKFVHLKGAGKYVTTINGFVTGADSCVIEDFYITKGIICSGTSPTILHNIITNKLTGDLINGIHITLAGRPWIKENEIVSCHGWGIYCYGFGSDPWIIANKIRFNTLGGIICINSSPLISNNFIDSNKVYGIYLLGALGTPAEPTIDDNVIGHTEYYSSVIGIHMEQYAEPRIIANDIYLNGCGIYIKSNTQPSVIGNNINYNYAAGIRCTSMGASKRVVITSNHIHSNINPGAISPAGIWVQNANPMITFNNITQNDTSFPPTQPDIDYQTCVFPNLPMISSNVFNIILKSSTPANGNYNVDSNGNPIAP